MSFSKPKVVTYFPTKPISTSGEGNEKEGRCESKELLEKKEKRLRGLEKEVKESIDRYNKLVEKIQEQYPYGYPEEWGEGNDECVSKVYEGYKKEVEGLKGEIERGRERCWKEYKKVNKKIKELGNVAKILVDKENVWENMLTVGGMWSQASVKCGGAVLMPGHSALSPSKMDVTPEQQARFQRDVAKGLMNGKGWEEAVRNAIVKNIPKEYAGWGEEGSEYIWKQVWQVYARCLKELYKEQLREYLKSRYLEVEERDIEKVIKGMFGDGDSEEGEKVREVRGEMEKARQVCLKEGEKASKAVERLRKLKRKFREQVKEECLNKKRKQVERKKQEKWILEAFLNYCSNSKGSYTFYYVSNDVLCSTLNNMLSSKDYKDNEQLVEFIKEIKNKNCDKKGVVDKYREEIEKVLNKFVEKVLGYLSLFH